MATHMSENLVKKQSLKKSFEPLQPIHILYADFLNHFNIILSSTPMIYKYMLLLSSPVPATFASRLNSPDKTTITSE
jgi:hypothetical protein